MLFHETIAPYQTQKGTHLGKEAAGALHYMSIHPEAKWTKWTKAGRSKLLVSLSHIVRPCFKELRLAICFSGKVFTEQEQGPGFKPQHQE